ncbi:LuxR family transcriptional regulator [Streptomyces sp. GC420]|uniref:helix-turn-helix transcriptional regulator n=1 Tax=Streptomyces sp. GC420 TaxID=2697568 RepID=UPI001414D9C0|nr:LuxR family transcriptional regulator [Streptomyces sp. GC420]
MPFTGRGEELERLRGGLRRAGCRGVVITGARGVGKSRLAEEFLAGAGVRHRTVRLLASEATADVPLSAFAPLLRCPVRPGEPALLFQEVRRALTVPPGEPRTVLLVDEAHHLDTSSLALLSALAGDSSVFLVATLPQDAEWPGVFRTLWRQDALEHLRLRAFDRDGTALLLRKALDAPVAAPAARALWEAGRGNALWSRELLRAAVREGALRQVGGVWCLARPLEQAILEAPAESRFRHLPEDRRAVLQLLALCGPVGLDDALAQVSPAALADLEEQGLVTVAVDGRRQRVALAHPWHALLLRRSTPRVLARRLLLEQAGRVRAHGAVRDGDALALARWELDATGTADPDLLVRAAGQALHAGDIEGMCRFAGAALEQGPGAHVLAGLMLGEALGQRGEFAESIPVLERAFASARSPEEVQAAAAALSQHHLYGRGQFTRGYEVLEQAAGRVGPRPLLTACRAALLSAVGRNRQAAGLLERQPPPVADSAGTTTAQGVFTQEDVLLLQAHMRVQLSAGRVEDAVRTGRDAYAVHCGLADRWTAYYPARSLYLVAAALLESGRPDEAERTAREGQEAMRDAVPALTVWFAWVRGRIALERGRVADALTHFREARALAQLSGQPFAEQRALAGLVLASAHAGHLAQEAGALAPASGRDASPLCQSDTLRAHGWLLQLRGKTSQARHLMLGAARKAVAEQETTAAAAILHDLLRWGVESAAAELRDAAAAMQGPLAAARAAHAAAAEGPDGAALEAVAGRMEELGLYLYAAEALAAAALEWRRRGRESRATRAAARSRALRGKCQDAATPALAEASAPVPLSTRERDIALMAARGCTSREIAETCVLSVRTVENHLGRVYRKLGITGRTALAEALLV